MPFYFRKSVSAGPFRFNFSKGGVGASVGIKGLRVGTGPRGHYIHAGAGGLYYRASTRGAGEKRRASEPQLRPSGVVRNKLGEIQRDENGVVMVEVESGDVLAMRDEKFSELLDELGRKQKQLRASSALGWGAVAAGGGAFFISPSLGLIFGLLSIPGWLIGRWLDSFWRTSVLFYDLDATIETAYQGVTESFDLMAQCEGKWHIEAGGAIQDVTTWKRNAGATHLVKKKPTGLSYALPKVIKSNITPPALQVGRQTMYFLPDVALIEDSDRLGAVPYEHLRIRWQDSNFIEEGRVPRDTEIVGHTWKHPNKSGGPDRRFRDNHQIPVCRYEVMHLSSATGLNEMVEFSKTGVCGNFAKWLAQLPKQTMAQLA